MTPTDPLAPAFDLYDLDMACARHYQMTPRDVDRLTPRDAAVMLHAAQVRERDALTPAMLLLDGLLNYAGMRGEDFRPVRFGYHLEQMLGGGEQRTSRAQRAKELALELKAARAAKWGITEGEA